MISLLTFIIYSPKRSANASFLSFSDGFHQHMSVNVPLFLHQALKIKVKEISYINGDTKIVPETKSKTIYKLNGVTERDLRKTVLWLKDGLQCICEEMNDINAAYLVMGQKMDGNLVITSLKRWQKGQREFKRISRSIRKLQC